MKALGQKILFTALVVVFFGTAFSQSTIQLKFSPLGIHPFNETNSHLFENKIDENGIFVTEPCFILSYEAFLRSDTFAFRGMLGFLSDAASKPAFLLHLGFKQRLIQVWRNSLSVGLGGNLYGRDSWSTIYGYVPDNSWAANGDWEYKIGYMAEIEYALFLNDNNDITLSAIYGHQPKTFTFTIGYKYWFSSIIKHPKKCGSCPFEKTSKHWNP
jgi:hypothetical protein